MTKEELKQDADSLYIAWERGYCEEPIPDLLVIFAEPREKRIEELEKENKKLNRQLCDIVECFQSASSGDDFEMAESAREIMEILDISCYRHGKVRSKLTEAKEIIKDFLLWENNGKQIYITETSGKFYKGNRIMTEEELAEEYADRTRIVDENTRAGTDCISLVQDYEGNVIDIHQRIKTAFLAGLKAKTQWHDLRKNPDDLPKTTTDVVCYCGKEWRKTIGKYWKEYQKWEVEGVIKWYELPECEED